MVLWADGGLAVTQPPGNRSGPHVLSSVFCGPRARDCVSSLYQIFMEVPRRIQRAYCLISAHMEQPDSMPPSVAEKLASTRTAHASMCVPHQKYILYVSYVLCVCMW